MITREDRRILDEARAIRRRAAAARKIVRADRNAVRGTPREANPREPRLVDKAYKGWIAGLPCLACALEGGERFGVHVAHVRAPYAEDGWREPGMGAKPSDHRCLPLCPDHHLDGEDAQHKRSERSWWAARGIYPPEVCAALREAFLAGRDGVAVLMSFVRSRP